jgi:hypothetical protein
MEIMFTFAGKYRDPEINAERDRLESKVKRMFDAPLIGRQVTLNSNNPDREFFPKIPDGQIAQVNLEGPAWRERMTAGKPFPHEWLALHALATLSYREDGYDATSWGLPKRYRLGRHDLVTFHKGSLELLPAVIHSDIIMAERYDPDAGDIGETNLVEDTISWNETLVAANALADRVRDARFPAELPDGSGGPRPRVAASTSFFEAGQPSRAMVTDEEFRTGLRVATEQGVDIFAIWADIRLPSFIEAFEKALDHFEPMLQNVV